MKALARRADYDESDRTTHVCAREGACRHRWALDPWLPVEPLEDAVRAQGGIPRALVYSNLAKVWHRARTARRLTVHQADVLAVNLLRRHAAEVWPEWFDLEQIATPTPSLTESISDFVARVGVWEQSA